MRFGVANACFLTLFLVLTCGTATIKGLSVLGVEFPDWAGIGKERSYLEGRAYESFPEISVESLSSTEFQNDFEQYVSDLVPMKDSAMMLNARLQRLGIEVAAIPAGYDTYPTYFGSDHAYDSESDSIVQTLAPRSDEAAVNLEEAAGAYSSFATRHDDLNIFFYRVDRVNSSVNNPTYELTGDSVDTNFLSDHFFGQLSEGITVIDGTFDSFDSMVEGYFRTDHHWTIGSAYDAYSSIAEALGLEAVPAEAYEEIVWTETPFYGSLSRSALCLPKSADVVSDYWFDLSGLDVVLDGKQGSGESLVHHSNYAKGKQIEDTYVNRYAEYFHSDYGLIEIRNEAASSDGTLLLVADSFSNNMERFFTPHYQNVLVLDPRYTDLTIEELVSEHDIEDVVFLLGSTTIATERTVGALR